MITNTRRRPRAGAPGATLATVLVATLAGATSTAGAGTRAGTPARADVSFVASSYRKIVLLSGTGQTVKTFGRGESPAFSPDGSRIAFVRSGDVFTVRTDGKGVARVTRTRAREESPDWGPDGSLVYVSNRGGRYELYVRNPRGQERRITRPTHRWQEDRSPAWSPDGRWIAFASNRPSTFNQELYLVRPSGAGLRRLTFTSGSHDVLGDDGMPTWRPDGGGLVFVSNRNRNFELYDLDLKTLETRRLTRTADRDEALPRISDDGRFAFVVPLPGGGSRISTANGDLLGRRVIQSGTAVDWRPERRAAHGSGKRAVSVRLLPVAGTGVSGTATLAAAGGGTSVSLDVAGFRPGARARSFLHAGTRSDLDHLSASFAFLPTLKANATGRARATAHVRFRIKGSEDVPLAAVADAAHVIVILLGDRVVAAGTIPRLAR